MSILQDICNGQYTPDDALKKMPSSLRQKEQAFHAAIEESMGAEFMERHWDGLCKAEDFKGYTNFREGFRLGVSLMLELLVDTL